MYKTHFGANRSKVFGWLTESWLVGESPVAFLEGFPGLGKSVLAEELVVHVRGLGGWSAVFDEVTDRATPSVRDMLYELADSLSGQGLGEMESVLVESREPNLAFAIEKALRRPVLIILDEAQRLFNPDSGQPLPELAGILSFLRTRPTLPGKLLLMSDRLIERARWSESFPIQTLTSLSDTEAEELLNNRLLLAGVSDAVPTERQTDLIRSLGHNPRAIETLVGALAFESLDEIIGRNPGLWEIHDREVSYDFLAALERDLLGRTIAHLNPLHYHRLFMLAAHRRSFESEALELVCDGTRKEWREFRNLLVTRFLVIQRLGWHSLHPIVREIGLAHLKESASDFIQAHSKAADYYIRHFHAKNFVITRSKMAVAFAELRYHLHHANRQADLRDVVLKLSDYLRNTIKSTSPVPTDSDELNERIAVLSVLLQDGGAKGLESHLAQCLRRRGKPADLAQAVIHAKSATGADAPAAAWVLSAQLQEQVGEVDEAVETIYSAIAAVSAHENLFSLYQYGAELLGKKGHIGDALLLLRKGLVQIPPEKNLFALYQVCAEMLGREGRAGEAIDLLRDGIGKVPPQFNRHRLVESLVYLAVADSRTDMLKELSLGSVEEAQTALAKNGLHQLEGDWVAAALAARDGRAYRPNYISLLIEEAFSWLGAGKSDQARGVLDSFENLRYEVGAPNSWLGCFVALRQGDKASARRFFAAYLGQDEAFCVDPTERDLLEIWNGPVAYSTPHPAHYFRVLPASLTGLGHPVIRPPTFEVCIEISSRIGATPTANVSAESIVPGVTPQSAPAEKLGSNSSILVLATEWQSKHGGLSTLNRELCCALADSGCRVVCLVPARGSVEVANAHNAGVELIEAPAEPGADLMSGLYRPVRLPPGFSPDVVIGHGRITGPAARAQVKDSFHGAKRIHFVHMAAGEIEWFKGNVDAAVTAEQRERFELDLATDAALVVAVGPRLYREMGNLLASLDNAPPIHQMVPGFKMPRGRTPPPALHCLILGRAEDLQLKGLDIGALGIAKVIAGKSEFAAPPELIVRGAPSGTGTKLRAELQALDGVGDLSIRVREYTNIEDAIEADLKRASLLLMPSRREGFGLVALEALEMGTPILVSDTSGIGEFLREVLSGAKAQHFVVETVSDVSKASTEWAKHIEIVLRDRETAFQRACTLSKELGVSYSWEIAIKSLRDAIDRVA